MVSRFEQRRDDVGVDSQGAGPDFLQHGLDSICKPSDRFQTDHRRGTLQTVRRAKRPIEVRTVPLTSLQVHQPFFQADQELARFFEEHLAEPVV